MKKYFDFVISSTGRPVVNGSVSVYGYGTTTLATIYSDAGGSVGISNPLTTDAKGYFSFYAADGRYSLSISQVGFSSSSVTDIFLDDPTNASPVAATSLTANTLSINGVDYSTSYATIVASTAAAASSATAAQVSADRAVAAWSASTSPVEQLASFAPSIHIGAIVKAILYDTSKDSYGGAWRKRCQHTSWFNETLGGDRWIGQQATIAAAWTAAGSVVGAVFQASATAGPLTSGRYYQATSATTATEVTRGISREFPAVVAIVAEASRVVIYDLTQASCPMWMVIKGVGNGGTSGSWYYSNDNVTSLAALNGLLLFGANYTVTPTDQESGLSFVSFVSDRLGKYGNTISGYAPLPVGSRATAQNIKNGSLPAIVNNYVLDVAITVLDTAPTDQATGLPVPTVAVATAGGLSTITAAGTVVNSTVTTSVVSVDFDGKLLKAIRSDGIVALYDDAAAIGVTPTTTLSASTIPATLGTVTKGTVRSKGSTSGVTLIKRNPAVQASSLVNYITNAYNTGWQVGDSRLAALADTVAETITSANPQADRSVKNNPLAVVGTLTKSAVASGAGLVAYSGFSASNYLEQPYSANLDFGTSDTGRFTWVKFAATAAKEVIWCRDSATTGVLSRLQVDVTTSFLSFTMFDGTTTRTATGTVAIDDGNWHLVETRYSAGTLTILVDGVSYATATGAALLTMNNTTAVLRVGVDCQGANPATNGNITLFRVSATLASNDQLAYIYRTELPLFQANAKCTIDGTSTAVTALAYDDVADELHVGTSWGRSEFRDLLRVASEATTTGAITSLSANEGVVLTGGASSGKVYAPAMYLRDELRRKDVARKALGSVPALFDYTATASQTVFVAPKGFTVKALYKNGTLMRETTTGVYWTRSNDGFQETATLSVGATVSDWISLMCVRA